MIYFFVRRFVNILRLNEPGAFCRIETAPDEEAQGGFGDEGCSTIPAADVGVVRSVIPPRTCDRDPRMELSSETMQNGVPIQLKFPMGGCTGRDLKYAQQLKS